MCGIFGFAGERNALPVLLDGLYRLEYRGYDSSGIAVFENGGIRVVKRRGKISALENELSELRDFSPRCGIGHTRWATHGEPTDKNSHPHLSKSGKIAVVHNGIIENYADIAAHLEKHGYTFVSETDTEVIAHLLDYLYDGDIITSLSKATSLLRGSYALGILCADYPGEIIAAKLDSPLIAGVGSCENFIASDISAFLGYTQDYHTLEDGEIAVISKDSVTVYDSNLNIVRKELQTETRGVEETEKGNFAHFMQKEIREQPKAVRDTLLSLTKDVHTKSLCDDFLTSVSRLHIVACGSAYHAGVVAKYVFEALAKIPVECDLASEFRYRSPILSKDELCIVISQSGETADTLAALREAKRSGVRTLAIVNVAGSSIAREADFVLHTQAGVEISVATTKAYSAQLITLYSLALKLSALRGKISDDEKRRFAKELTSLPEKIEDVISRSDPLSRLALRFSGHEDIFFTGRGVDSAAALEGSLKLKEISYIRSEAYPAGEFKHGSIALIDRSSLVIAIATNPDLSEKTISNIRELKSRGAHVFSIVAETIEESVSDVSDDVFVLPACHPLFSPSLSVVAMQIFAYHIALARGCDIDKPRNLAKSVTVE